MAETACLSGSNDWIDLDFVERERTPKPAMKLGIQMHLAGRSLSNTVSVLVRCPQKSEISDGLYKSSALVNAANPKTNELLHLRLFSTTTTALTEIFLRELQQKHDVEDAVFLVNGATHLQAALHRAGL